MDCHVVDGQGWLVTPSADPLSNVKLADDFQEFLREVQQFVTRLASAIRIFCRSFCVPVNLADALSHFTGRRGRFGDSRSDCPGTGRCFGHVLGDLPSRGGLLLDRGRDRAGGRVDVGDHLPDFGNGLNRLTRRILNGLDPMANVFRGFCRLLGEFLDFGGDDREAFARFAGPRRLDGGIQGQQIGLLGDILDHGDDLADLFGGRAELADSAVALFRQFGRSIGNAGRLLGATGDFGDRRRHFIDGTRDGTDIGRHLLGRASHRAHVDRHFLRRRCHVARLLRGFSGRRRQLLGGYRELGGRIGQMGGVPRESFHHAAQFADQAVDRDTQLTDFVLGLDRHLVGQVAVGELLEGRDGFLDGTRNESGYEHEEHAAADADQTRDDPRRFPKRGGGACIGFGQRLDDLEGAVDFSDLPVLHFRAGRVEALIVAPQTLGVGRIAVAEHAFRRQSDRSQVPQRIVFRVDRVILLQVRVLAKGLESLQFERIGLIGGVPRLDFGYAEFIASFFGLRHGGPMNTVSTGTSRSGVPAVRPMYSSARSAASRSAGSAKVSGSGTRRRGARPGAGLVPQET